jgi:hypothetical protein
MPVLPVLPVEPLEEPPTVPTPVLEAPVAPEGPELALAKGPDEMAPTAEELVPEDAAADWLEPKVPDEPVEPDPEVAVGPAVELEHPTMPAMMATTRALRAEMGIH